MGGWTDEQRNIVYKYNGESKLKQAEKKKKQILRVISYEVVWGVSLRRQRLDRYLNGLFVEKEKETIP